MAVLSIVIISYIPEIAHSMEWMTKCTVMFIIWNQAAIFNS